MVNSKMQAFARYAFENKDEFATATQPYSKKLDVPESARNQNIALNLIRTWSPRIATESRIVYSRVVGDPDRFGGNSPDVTQFLIFSSKMRPTLYFPLEPPRLKGWPPSTNSFRPSLWFATTTAEVRADSSCICEKHTYGYRAMATPISNVQGFVDGRAVVLCHCAKSERTPSRGVRRSAVRAAQLYPPLSLQRTCIVYPDTWKITPRLTLTPGLRWEYFDSLHSPGAEHALDSNFYLGSSEIPCSRLPADDFCERSMHPVHCVGASTAPLQEFRAPARLGHRSFRRRQNRDPGGRRHLL